MPTHQGAVTGPLNDAYPRELTRIGMRHKVFCGQTVAIDEEDKEADRTSQHSDHAGRSTAGF